MLSVASLKRHFADSPAAIACTGRNIPETGENSSAHERIAENLGVHVVQQIAFTESVCEGRKATRHYAAYVPSTHTALWKEQRKLF